MRYLVPVLTAIILCTAWAWECPRCEKENQGEFCSSCGLLKPPSGMAFIAACAVEVDGVSIEVEPFYIDSTPTTYREVLPWMEENMGSMEELAYILVGQLDENYQFLNFTPFVNNESGSAMTVPSDCFGLPAASFTWEGATLYLLNQGKQLPTTAQLTAALNAGVIQKYDVYSVMLTYADIMTATMGSLLGSIGNQAMFAGQSTANERIMWEWSRDVWGQVPASETDMIGIYRTLFKPLESPELGVAGRDMGYFNVTFRGVVMLPMEW